LAARAAVDISRGEFAGRVAVPRVLDVLKLDEGHEIGHHGYHHVTPATMEEAAEHEQIEKGLEAMDRALDGHRAVGYRSPGAELSPNSTRLLAENGFIYESSMSAQDFEPYWCRTGDVIEPNGVATFGPEVELLEIPGGVYTICFHPEIIGRGARVRVLERMIARAKEHRVQFMPARAAAEDWIRRHPFDHTGGGGPVSATRPPAAQRLPG
jgi:peptidoglycan/xylan/chitin deacetylase (PgdA/CDA1 family)